MKNRSILVVTYFFPPARAAEAICSANVISSLSEQGYDVTVVTSNNPQQLEDFEYRNLVHEKVKVLSVPDPNRKGNLRVNKLRRMMTLIPDGGALWVKEAAKAATVLLERRPMSLLYSRSMPGASAIAALQVVETIKIPWIAHFSDPWPSAPNIKRPLVHDYLLNRYFARILHQAEGLSFTCEACSNYVKRRYGRQANTRKMFITSHIGKIIDFDRNETRLPRDQFRIAHAGSFYGSRTPWTLLDGFAEFVRKCKDPMAVKLILIGLSAWNLKAKAEELGISANVEILGEIGLAETQRNMHKASALVLVEAEQNEPLFLPSKLAEYAFLNKPIIALTPEGSPTRHLLHGDPGALCIVPSNTSGLTSALFDLFERVYSSAKGCEGSFLHERMRRVFSKDIVLSTLVDFIDRLA